MGTALAVIRRAVAAVSLGVLVHAVATASAAPDLEPDPRHSVNGSIGGPAMAFTIESAILGQTRHVGIVLPASHASTGPGRRYPVVVVLDGEADLAPAAAASRQLAGNGLIPETILVAIENEDPYRGRVHDLTPPGLSVSGSGLEEGGDQFLDFIEHELLPAVDRRFRGSAPRALIGHSSGGILATWAAATRPAFRAVVAIDAPLGLSDAWLARRLVARAQSDSTPLRYCYYEVRFPWPGAEWATLETARPATWKIHREKLEREGHETAFLLGAYLGLREAFGDYSRMAAPAFPTTRILPYYEALAKDFGAPMTPPRRVLHDVVENFIMEGRGAAAHRAYDQLVAGYGAPADSAELTDQFRRAEKEPPPTETVEGLLATSPPTAQEAKAFLGDWAGETWQRSTAPHAHVTLHVTIEDGRVVADLENPQAPPQFRMRRMQYLKVTPQGLSFGIMNGMRPYGLIVYEGIRTGDRLAGTQRWGGINFKLNLPGVEPDDPGFSFTRVRPTGS